MFAKIADFITRRYKYVIAFWLIALLIALPFAPMVNDVVKYDETAMAPSTLDSEVAQRYIDDHFGPVSERGSTIIVLTSDDVTDDAMRGIVDRIHGEILNATQDGRIKDNVTVDDLYSTVTAYTSGYLQALSSGYAQVNQTAYIIFGLPEDFASLYDQAGQAAFMVYGVPALTAQTWAQTASSMPAGTSVAQIDAATYDLVLAQLQAQSESMSSDQKRSLISWFGAFMNAWNGTASSPLSADPVARAQATHDQAFSSFLSAIPVDDEERSLIGLVNGSFTMSDFADHHALDGFVKDLMDQEMGPELAQADDEQKALIQDYFGTFYSLWNASSGRPSVDEFHSMVGASVQQTAGLIPDQSTREALLAVYQGMGFSAYDDSSSRDRALVDITAQIAGTTPAVVSEVRGLGDDPSNASLSALAGTLVSSYSIREFPIPLPSAMLSTFVNSPDNDTMIIALTYAPVGDGSSPGQDYVPVIRDIVKDALGGSSSVRAYVSGNDPLALDLKTSTNQDIERIDPITVILVLVLIGLFFRSFVASSIPPITVGMALGISYAAVYAIGAFLLDVHYSVLTLMLTSMMGAGCDYCIFILSRYREERRNGLDKDRAVRTAVTWAGESIATSAATVIIGFGVLSIGQFSMMKSMGIGLALGITVALLISLTLLPSLLVLLGDRMFWPTRLDRPVPPRLKPSYFTKSAKFAIKHAKVLLVVAVLISIPTTYLVYSMETSYDFFGAMPETESKAGLDALSDGFGSGRVLQTQVALEMQAPIVDGGTLNITELNAIEDTTAKIAAMNNVKEVSSPTRPLGELIAYSNLSSGQDEEAAQYISLMEQSISTDSRVALITVTFSAGPFSQASLDTVQEIRDLGQGLPSADPTVTAVYVAGGSAIMADIAEMVQNDFRLMEVLAVLGIYIVLLVVLGSAVNPLRSILTILLSISWTIAATLVVFKYILGMEVLWMVPMILLVVCLGLGMDYDILLTTRVREEAASGRENNDAIVHAVERTGGIITACGIVMAAAFATLMLSNGYLLKEFGFALMFAILLDATIVRIYLVPAIMSLLGKWNWWAPAFIQRINDKRGRAKESEMEKYGARSPAEPEDQDRS